jgi:hypothetical protein
MHLYGVVFLFIYIIYSYSFVESVRKNCGKKKNPPYCPIQ